MCKNAENGAKFPISTKYAVEKLYWATALAARASRAGLRWPVVRLRHGPITATRAGLLCDFEKPGSGTTVASSRNAV